MKNLLAQNTKWRKFLFGSLAAVTAAVVLQFGQSNLSTRCLQQITGKQPVAVTVAPVSLHNKPMEVVLAGSVEGSNTALVTAEYSGFISEVYVTEGQTVKAGQPLLRIEGGEKTETSAATDSTEAALPPVTDNMTREQAQSEVERLSGLLSRYQGLYDQGAIARRKLEDTASQLKAAQDALAELPESTPSSDAVPVPGNSSRRQNATNLTATVDGIVTGLTAIVGNRVQTGQQLMVLDSGETVRVVGQAGQKDVRFIHSGTPAAIIAESAPDQVLAGKLEGIFPGSDPGDSLQFRTHIQVDNSSGILKSGMKVDVRLNTGILVPVQTVPASAVFQEEGRCYLFLAVDGKAVRQEVTMGAALGDLIEITSDLPEDSLVIAGEAKGLRDGDAITIKKME